MDTIDLSSLKGAPGSRRPAKRLGLGEGSGGGQTATRGMKGQRSRSGDGKMPGFEGGQTPLLRRIPKRGFTNGPFRVTFQVVSLGNIERVFNNQTEVTLDALKIHGLVSGRRPVKILSDGDVTRPFKVSAHAFSTRAQEKIKKAGGSVEIVPR